MRVPTANKTALRPAKPANSRNMPAPPKAPSMAPPSVGPMKLPMVENE